MAILLPFVAVFLLTGFGRLDLYPVGGGGTFTAATKKVNDNITAPTGG